MSLPSYGPTQSRHSAPHQGCSASSDTPALGPDLGNSHAMTYGVMGPQACRKSPGTSQKTFGPIVLPWPPMCPSGRCGGEGRLTSGLHPRLILIVRSSGFCPPRSSPAVPTAAAAQGTHPPAFPSHPQERTPHTGGDGEKEDRG